MVVGSVAVGVGGVHGECLHDVPPVSWIEEAANEVWSLQFPRGHWHCLHWTTIGLAYKKANKFTNNSLCPIEGQLKSWLDHSFPHRPVLVDKKNPTCQLHCWAHNAYYGDSAASAPPGSRSNVMACDSCNVKLCLWCFYIFHKNQDVSECIDAIINDQWLWSTLLLFYAK